jgi:hypothetical protein
MSSLLLDAPAATSGAALDQATPTRAANQQWRLEPSATPGFYVFLTNAANLVLSSPSWTQGDALVVRAPTGSPSEEWQLVAF